MARRTLFVTGFPGFIGRWLLRALVERRRDLGFVFLVQERFVGDARRALDELKQDELFREASFEVVTGDITWHRFGLDDGRYGELAAKVTDVFNLAAIYDLAVPEAAARRVNVEGTRVVLDFCGDVRKLRSLVHFSTCYVAGRRHGTCLEDELEHTAGFKNHYESTKHESEKLVRARMDRLPTLIIRPGITVGDSRTGRTRKFDGPYFGMILIDRLKLLQIPLPYLGPSSAEVNLVPVDFVADGTAAIWDREGTTGKCYAMADPHPVTARTLYANLVRLLGARGPFAQIPPVLMEAPLRLFAVRKLLGVPREVLDYFNHTAHYDTRNATAALQGTGVSCPPFLDYLPTLVRFYQENRQRDEFRWKPY